MPPPLALIVDPDSHFLPRLGEIVERAGWNLLGRTTFAGARQELETKRPGAVVANVRLGMFNGVHLAYLAKLAVPEARTIVYAEVDDPVLAAEAQRASAFYERREWLMYSLPSYLQSDLPAEDRRSVWNVDRRQVFRGGRRTTDQRALRLARNPSE
jgi:hypothetical protein